VNRFSTNSFVKCSNSKQVDTSGRGPIRFHITVSHHKNIFQQRGFFMKKALLVSAFVNLVLLVFISFFIIRSDALFSKETVEFESKSRNFLISDLCVYSRTQGFFNSEKIYYFGSNRMESNIRFCNSFYKSSRNIKFEGIMAIDGISDLFIKILKDNTPVYLRISYKNYGFVPKEMDETEWKKFIANK
jgi:hypothetical protein